MKVSIIIAARRICDVSLKIKEEDVSVLRSNVNRKMEAKNVSLNICMWKG
jgi:FixJ family two-component response regulator